MRASLLLRRKLPKFFLRVRLHFSEGKTLTKEDEKTYWGKISYGDGHEMGSKGESSSQASENLELDVKDEESKNNNRRLYVQGSVIFGYGLEPQPVGRFVMTETTETDLDDEEEDEDEDEPPSDSPEDFLDWSDAFQ